MVPRGPGGCWSKTQPRPTKGTRIMSFVSIGRWVDLDLDQIQPEYILHVPFSSFPLHPLRARTRPGHGQTLGLSLGRPTYVREEWGRSSSVRVPPSHRTGLVDRSSVDGTPDERGHTSRTRKRSRFGVRGTPSWL